MENFLLLYITNIFTLLKKQLETVCKSVCKRESNLSPLMASAYNLKPIWKKMIRQDSVACGNFDFSGVTTFQVWPGLGLVERYQLGGGNIAKTDDTPTVRLKPTLIRVYSKMFCQQ